jgi:hypothetical protein
MLSTTAAAAVEPTTIPWRFTWLCRKFITITMQSTFFYTGFQLQPPLLVDHGENDVAGGGTQSHSG